MAKYAIDYDRKLAAKVRKAIKAGLEISCHKDGNGQWDVTARKPYAAGQPIDYGNLLGVVSDFALVREWESMSRTSALK